MHVLIPQSHLVSLGALSTLFMMSFTPFTQQALSLTSVRYKTWDTVRPVLYQAFNYTPEHMIAGSPNYAKFGRLPGKSLPEAVMMAGMNNGMVARSVLLSDFGASCETSNCTFDEYTTLGLCVKAANATDMIQPRSNCTSAPVFAKDGSMGNYTVCDVRILADTSDIAPLRELPSSEGGQLWVGNEYDGHGKFTVYIIYEDLPWVPMGSSKQRSWSAVEGTLQTCALTLKTSVVNGQTNSTMISETLLTTNDCIAIKGRDFCPGAIDEIFEVLASFFNGRAAIWPGGDNYFDSKYIYYLFLDIYGPQVYDWESAPVESEEKPWTVDAMDGFWERLYTLAASITNAWVYISSEPNCVANSSTQSQEL